MRPRQRLHQASVSSRRASTVAAVDARGLPFQQMRTNESDQQPQLTAGSKMFPRDQAVALGLQRCVAPDHQSVIASDRGERLSRRASQPWSDRPIVESRRDLDIDLGTAVHALDDPDQLASRVERATIAHRKEVGDLDGPLRPLQPRVKHERVVDVAAGSGSCPAVHRYRTEAAAIPVQ